MFHYKCHGLPFFVILVGIFSCHFCKNWISFSLSRSSSGNITGNVPEAHFMMTLPKAASGTFKTETHEQNYLFQPTGSRTREPDPACRDRAGTAGAAGHLLQRRRFSQQD